MKCNLECPFAKYNGRNHNGTQDIICTRRNWFRDSSDDCIEGYTEKEMELLKRKYPSHPKERYRVFIEHETGDNVIVDMDEIPTDSNVVSLTLEDTCQRLNEQDQKIKAIEKLLDNELKKAFNNRINHDDYAEDAELAEYFKGYHCGVGDLEKKIRHILFNK